MTDTAIPHPLARRIAPPRMPGMPAAFRERPARNDLRDMPFGDRPAPPVDREVVERRPRALQRRLRRARPRHRDACFEDIDLTRRRGPAAASCPASATAPGSATAPMSRSPARAARARGRIARALARKACPEGFRARCPRVPRPLTELRTAHGEGTIPGPCRDLARLDAVILDDWGPAAVDAARARDPPGIPDDRFGRRSVTVTPRPPVAGWHRKVAEPTIADAILDRVVHGAVRFEPHGSSMRADSTEAGT